MHYLGMSALELPGHIAWELPYVVASILIGIVFATAALAVAARWRSPSATWLAALLLTLAIVSHHFVAMGAVDVVPDPTRTLPELSLSPASLALAVASIAIAILGMSLISAFADRKLDDKGRLLEIALDNLQQGVVMFDTAGRLVVSNDRYRQMYGLSADIVKPGSRLVDIVRHRFATGSQPRFGAGTHEGAHAMAAREEERAERAPHVAGATRDEHVARAFHRTVILRAPFRFPPDSTRCSGHNRNTLHCLLLPFSDLRTVHNQ